MPLSSNSSPASDLYNNHVRPCRAVTDLSGGGLTYPPRWRKRLMAGLLRGGFATGLCLWLLGAPAEAHGFGWRRPWSASYYAPAYYAPAYRLSYYPAVY